MIRRPIRAMLMAFLVAACSVDIAVSPPPATPSQAISIGDPTAPPVSLTIYAAASLEHALDAVKTAYEAANPRTTLTISTDSSAALEAKIEQGAPADLFLSADATNPAKLRAGGFTADDPVAFAGNTLVIIVPEDNPAGITSPFDLAKGGVKVIAAGDDVPITTYARKLVQNLAIQPAAPGGFDLAYEANVVSREDNVQAVVAKVELGEGDAAIVYATDAAASGKVDSVRIRPETANVTATYEGVVVVRTLPQQAYATEFLHWLAGPDGAAILEGFGFLPAP
ncbi:MAG TPA: molybdate ABC transporter substrate-binding protein [Candidatus Limnocylindrales bacterium]|nr:molybdate ABC transporter substrate-binding protein [Candidatus Limnocylindrales bacterium]